MYGPSQGREPLQLPSGGFSPIRVASKNGRSTLHSQRITISARSPLVPRSSIQRARRASLQSVCTLMDEGVPVDVVDVPFPASLDKADRHDWLRTSILVDESPLRERRSVDQAARTGQSVPSRTRRR